MGLPLALSLLAILSASPCLPQRQAVPTAERMPSPMRHAGIYHLTTGTWTRTGGATASFGPDVIYNATAPSGYFSGIGTVGTSLEGATMVDSGGVPGPSNGHPFLSPPTQSNHAISSFEFGYCDFSTSGSSSFEVSFMSSYIPCSGPLSAPDATFMLTGLPVGGCWTIDVDLTGGAEFCLATDGGNLAPGWDDDPDLDSFGWSGRYAGTTTATVGFPMTGDPVNTDPNFTWPMGSSLDAVGTAFGPSSLCAPGGSGYLNVDSHWLESPIYDAISRCHFFGGYRRAVACGTGTRRPFASFHMLLRSSSACSGTPSPCAGGGSPGLGTTYCAGVVNSTGEGGATCVFGSPAAVDDNVELVATQLPVGTFGFFMTADLQAVTLMPGMSQGNLCLSGSIGRFVGPGQIKMAQVDGSVSLNTNLGEWSLAALPGPMGSTPAVAGQRSNFQFWYRDAPGGLPTSNFTSAIEITWL